MAGNVGEMTNDWWSGSLPNAAQTDPVGPAYTINSRTTKGGGWQRSVSFMPNTNRGPSGVTNHLADYGFRICRTVN